MSVTTCKNILTIKSSDGQVYVKQADLNIKDFARTMRANIRAFWSGEWDYYQFLEAMVSAIRYGYTRAWKEGAAQCGIGMDDLTVQEMSILQSRIVSDQAYAEHLADDIAAGSKANGGLLRAFAWRTELWVNNYNEMRNTAQLMACSDQKLRWVKTARESCTSCVRLNGKVKRASYWREHDVYPQHHSKLACMISSGGVPVCRCHFEQTDDPITPGPLPNLP
jgi:hypothetical protein